MSWSEICIENTCMKCCVHGPIGGICDLHWGWYLWNILSMDQNWTNLCSTLGLVLIWYSVHGPIWGICVLHWDWYLYDILSMDQLEGSVIYIGTGTYMIFCPWTNCRDLCSTLHGTDTYGILCPWTNLKVCVLHFKGYVFYLFEMQTNYRV